MIKFANSDGKIWNRDQLIIDVAHAMSQGATRIDISTNGEGPCSRSLGLYDLLDTLCERFQYQHSNIYITTCNLIETHDYYNIIINPQTKYLKDAQQYMPLSGTKQITKHFGHFIGHGNYPRLCIGSYLHSCYPDKTFQSYHTKVTNEYHKSFIGIEDMMFNQHSWDEVQSALNLLKSAPLTIDKIDQYPILSPTTLNITKIYPEFFVEIVNLTYWSGDTFYIDEKIWRPMLMKTPFIVQGPTNFIQRFKRLGFKTFDQWWDEGYSEDPADFQLIGIKENINQLAQLSISELSAMYQNMQSVLEHNWHRMQEITRKDFLK